MTLRTNARMMSKADDNNDYDYDQALGEKQTEQRCNNVTSGEFLKRKSQAEKSRSGSHVTTIIQDFTLVSLTSSVMPHLAGLPLEATVPSLFTHSFPYALVSLRTRFTITSVYQPEEHSA